MHEADDAYSIRSTWSCYWLDQFLTLALNILILSIFYISMDLSTNYFAHFSGCWASFACSCHYPRMLCHVFWSQVGYKIVCFILLWSYTFVSPSSDGWIKSSQVLHFATIFWAFDNIFSLLYALFCIWMKWNFVYLPAMPYWLQRAKKNKGSTIRFCNLASSIEITYIPVAIEPRRFGKHEMYHIMPQEVTKQSLGTPSSDLLCSWQKRTFSSAKYTFSSHSSIWKSLWNAYNNYNRKGRLLFDVSATFKYIIKCHPPYPSFFVHFKHTFVTHPTKISLFTITVTPPPRDTACHPPKFWTCTRGRIELP